MSQQQAQEAERLRAAMEALLQEAGQRTRKEVLFYCAGYFTCTLYCSKNT